MAGTTATATATANSPPPILTDEDIVRLAQNQTQTCAPIPPYLLSPQSHPTILSYLNSRCSSPSPSISVNEYTLSLLSLISLSPHNPSLSSLLSSLLVSYTQVFTSFKIPRDSNSLKTLQRFGTLLDHIPKSDVAPIIDSIVSYLPQIVDTDDTQILDLLPRCLDLTRNVEEIECVGDYANSVFDRMLDCNWSKNLLIKMVSLVREFPIVDKEKMRIFLEKVLSAVDRVDLQDLPSLVYQLLLLASRGFNKREVIEAVVMLFRSGIGWSKGRSITRQIEGTVLLHMNFAVKQDPSLGQEIMGLVRSDPRAFNHFTVSILLSIASVRRFNENSMGILKTVLLNAYHDYNFAKDCKWLPDDLKEDYKRNIKVIEKEVLSAVNESNNGREHILPSILQFGFLLLESVEERKWKDLCNSGPMMGIEQLGIEMLKSLFEVHYMNRNEIIEQCKFRILSLKPEQSISIIRLLGYLTQNYPYPMLEHVSHLKELLDYFTYEPGKIATFFITALLPLIKYSGNLQDYAILALRKAMFHRDATVRLAATNAIIDLISVEKQSNRDNLFPLQESSSQASCSQQAEIDHGKAGGLFQELSGLLQRCLYQQAEVREVMYCGLLKLVLTDPSTGGAVLDFLLPHFLQFYNKDADAQLGISCCVKSENGRVVIEEPLYCLLSCVSWILFLQPSSKPDQTLHSSWACLGFSLSQDNEAERNVAAESFGSAFLKIRKFLRNPKLDGIIHQTQNASSASPEEKKSKCCALVLSGIIEVILNSVANELEKAVDEEKENLEKEFTELVDVYETLGKDLCASRLNNGIRRGNPRPAGPDVPDSDLRQKRLSQGLVPFLATSSIYQLLQATMELYNTDLSKKSEGSQKQSQSSATSKCCSRIISFVLNVFLSHMKSFAVVGKEDPLKTLVYGDIKMLGPPLFKLIILLKTGKHISTNQKKREVKGKKKEDRREHLHLALMCLKELLVATLRSPDFTGLLDGIVLISASEYAGLDDACEAASRIDEQHLRSRVLFIFKTLKPLLSELLAVSSFNEVEIICDIILMIGNQLPCKWRDSIGAWAVYVCKSNEIANYKVARNVVTLAISLSLPPNDLILAKDMAAELFKAIGSHDDEPDDLMQVSESYPLINCSTKETISSSLQQIIGTVINDIDWAVKKLKANSLFIHKSPHLYDNGKQELQLAFEENLYSRAEAVVKVLASFVWMNLDDSQAEHLLRLSERVYKHLAALTKLRIAPRGWKQLTPSLKFQQLVELTCKELTVPLYDFVENVQKKQRKNTKTKGILNKIKRENRCIPDLVFHIEDYEKYLIQLSKLSKVNLLKHAKRSTARDFRILDNDVIVEEDDAPNHRADNNSSAPAENESFTDSEDSQGNGSEKILSPETGSPLAIEDSGTADQDEDGLPTAKKVKRSRIVQDSDDDV
ncbi:Fanconi anemia group I protein [Quillaja saponaria]|uniref:Fanconi anemia group I protein n=1 Tax=Quillaja saponaria TaxID=32244 RepID=A0AAD7LBM5_QUISA|nr:Fanconi anemia group I protein [Quillaja saponaria]